MKFSLQSILSAVAVASLLAACGGGGGDFRNDTRSSGRSASLTVSAAGTVALNGVYSSTDVFLNDVEKINPIGGDPETCRMRFSGLRQVGNTRTMDGDIRYIPGSTVVRTTFVSIDAVEFRLEQGPGVAVDRAGNMVNYTGAVLTSTQGTGQTITLIGSVPLRPENKPEGC